MVQRKQPQTRDFGLHRLPSGGMINAFVLQHVYLFAAKCRFAQVFKTSVKISLVVKIFPLSRFHSGTRENNSGLWDVLA